MIHYFSVSNYYSIRKEVVLDFRIPKTAPDLPHFRKSLVNPDIRLPSVIVLTGPNGSGKTTLLRALVDAIALRLHHGHPIRICFRCYFFRFFLKSADVSRHGFVWSLKPTGWHRAKRRNCSAISFP